MSALGSLPSTTRGAPKGASPSPIQNQPRPKQRRQECSSAPGWTTPMRAEHLPSRQLATISEGLDRTLRRRSWRNARNRERPAERRSDNPGHRGIAATRPCIRRRGATVTSTAPTIFGGIELPDLCPMPAGSITRSLILQVECPRCGAPAREKCRSNKGNVGTRYAMSPKRAGASHKERMHYAQELGHAELVRRERRSRIPSWLDTEEGNHAT